MELKLILFLILVIMSLVVLFYSIRKVHRSVFVANISNTTGFISNTAKVISNTAELVCNKTANGFYRYVLAKGINIRKVSNNKFRISYLRWNCVINTMIAKRFKRKHISWKDMFETDIKVLSRKTIFSPDTLRKKMGVLPADGTPIILVARQQNVNIPKQNVIIRLNNHGPLDARTTMIMTWGVHVKTLTMCAREQPNKETVRWTHYKPYGNDYNHGLWNTSQPLVVPEDVWGFENLTYYRGPLFFMKGGYFFGHFADCNPEDGIGLGALNRVAHLKGDISTLGFSTELDEYNKLTQIRFKFLAHKLPWAYFVVKELTDTKTRR